MIERITTPSYLTIVTRDEAKAHLRVTHADDDAYIDTLIEAACEHVESLGQFWLDTDVEGKAYFDHWPSPNNDMECISYIRIANVTAIDSVKYYASGSGTLTDNEDVETSVKRSPAQVLVKASPLLNKKRDGIVVSFKAGWETVPSKVKQAILLVIGNLYETRQEEVIGTIISKSVSTTVDILIRNHKLFMPQ